MKITLQHLTGSMYGIGVISICTLFYSHGVDPFQGTIWIGAIVIPVVAIIIEIFNN